MDESKWERVAAGAGIVTFVLVLVANLLVTKSPPKMTDSAATIVAFVSAHRSALVAQTFMTGLAFAVFFVWFLGSLRTFLLRAEEMPGRLSVVAFGAGLLVVAIGAIGATVKGAVALTLAAHGDPGVVQGMYVLSNFAFTSTGFVAGVLVGATSIVVLQTKALPVWYGSIGVVLGVVFVLSALGTTTETGALSPTGNLQVIALTLFGLWILVTSILLVQRIGVKSAGPTAMPPMDSPAPTV